MRDNELPDLQWARCAGIAGIVAVVSFIPLVTVDLPLWTNALLTFGFGGGIALASVALHLGVTSHVAPRLGLIAAIANVVAAGELVAMLLVQIAVRAAVPRPDDTLIAIWLGLDVAWDFFVGTGTLLFGVALWNHARFRPIIASLGILAGLLLVGLNASTFPTPPAEAGLFDIGPFVGLWYFVLSVRVLMVAQGERNVAMSMATATS